MGIMKGDTRSLDDSSYRGTRIRSPLSQGDKAWDKDSSILGSILMSPYFGKPPYREPRIRSPLSPVGKPLACAFFHKQCLQDLGPRACS